MRIFTSTALCFALSAEAMALNVPLDPATSKKLESVTLDNCGPGAEVRLEAGDRVDEFPAELMIIDFTDLSVRGQANPKKQNCTVKGQVKVAAGMQLRINAGSIFGYSDLTQAPSGAQSEVNFSYSMPLTGDGWAASGNYSAGSLEDINLLAAKDGPRFSSCKNNDQVVELIGKIQIGLSGQLDDRSSVQITGGAENIGLGWNWGWADCFRGDFTSQYTAYNGTSYTARFTLNGSETDYESSAGFTGHIYDLKRQGRVLSGKWSSGNQSGYIEFRISDFTTGRFDGEWGEVNAQGQRVFKGKWQGQKAN